jgi:DNA-binding MarR family transcriptional regulator
MKTNLSQVSSRKSCSVAEAMTDLTNLLPRVIRGMKRNKPAELEELVRSAQLGPRHGSALYALLEGPTIVGTLATRLGLSLATTSNLVAELDRAGLVERRPDPADRRRTIVTITEERRPSIESWLTHAAAPFVRTLERLSPSERATFVKGLHTLDEELCTADPDAVRADAADDL